MNNSNKILTLSGWAQRPDFIAGLKYVDYMQSSNAGVFFSNIAGADPDILIGWSLGGQLAVNAILQGAISPKKLILLATPFNFIADENFECGIQKAEWQKIVDNFKNNKAQAVVDFNKAVTHNSNYVVEPRDDIDNVDIYYWLDYLGRQNFSNIDFSDFPSTYIFHSKDDEVIGYEHSKQWNRAIKGSKIELLKEGYGHVPFLSNKFKKFLQSIA